MIAEKYPMTPWAWIPIEEIEQTRIKPLFMKEYIHEIISERRTIHIIEERDR